jgi:hypothetical protein
MPVLKIIYLEILTGTAIVKPTLLVSNLDSPSVFEAAKKPNENALQKVCIELKLKDLLLAGIPGHCSLKFKLNLFPAISPGAAGL